MNKKTDEINKMYDQCKKSVCIMRDNAIDSSKIISNVLTSNTFKIAPHDDKLLILKCLTFFNEFNLLVEILANNSILNSVSGMKHFIDKMFKYYDFICKVIENVINDNKGILFSGEYDYSNKIICNIDFLISYDSLKKDLIPFILNKHHLSKYDQEGVNRINYYLDRMIDENIDFRKRKYAELRSKEILNRIKDNY